MDWRIILIGFGILFLIFSIFYRIKSKQLGKLSINKKKIVFATPSKTERILLVLYFIFFLWWDVLQNIVILRGTLYKVTWFGDVTTNAFGMALILLFIFHTILFTLFLMSLKSKSTHRRFDIIAGVIATFGVAIVLSGFINSLHSGTIFGLNSTSYYHLGVVIEILYGLYLTFTK